MNAVAAIVWDPVFPLPAIAGPALALAALAVWTTWRTGPRMARWRRASLCLLRVAGLALLCVPLLQPARERTIARRHPERLGLVAIDTSQSMAEKDAGGATRLDAALDLIRQHLLTTGPAAGQWRYHQFDVDSRLVAPSGLDRLQPLGDTTRFDTSLSGILRSLSGPEQSAGLFVFTDGHDFEGVPPARLGKLARAARTPIFPVLTGRTLQLPDVAVTMTSTQPSTFVKQISRLTAAVRFRSCGARQTKVELLRAGTVLRDQTITSTGDGEVPVAFDVVEEEPGQYEYEIRCAPMPGERDAANNTAFTWLNVTDARIPVLLVEGQPHWDTSFLQRTLARNDRMSLDSVSAVGKNRLHTSRSDAGLPKLEAVTPALLQSYPIIILGRNVDGILGAAGIAAITKAVSEGGMTLVFARGLPGRDKAWNALAPAPFSEESSGPVTISPAAAGGASVAPVDILRQTGRSPLPDLPAAAGTGAPGALASVELRAEDRQQVPMPAMLHRQTGSGQVFAVALDGLWKWSLNPGAEPDNNIHDRFWNQLILNLLVRSSRTPSDKAQLTVARANLTPGEQALFTLRLPVRPGSAAPEFKSPPSLRLTGGEAEAATVQMNRAAENAPWTAAIPVPRAGRFRAEVTLPSGETLSCRFGASAAAGETTDVSTDGEYLRQLAEASGGRVLDGASLGAMLETLTRTAEAERFAPPAVKREDLWDNARFFWLLCGLFAADWFLRRRWGLV